MARFPALDHNLSAVQGMLRDRLTRNLYGTPSQRLT